MKRTRAKIEVCCDDNKGGTLAVCLPGFVLDGTVWAVTPTLGEESRPLPGFYTVTHVPTGRCLAPGMALPAAAVVGLVEGLAADVPRWGADLPFGYGVTQGGREGGGPGAARVLRAVREANALARA